MSDLDVNRIRRMSRNGRLGARVVAVERTGSTMDDLAALADEGAPEGTVIVADVQTAGRGRHDREWQAPPGTALLLSMLFRPRLPPARGAQVSMAVALGALDALAPHAAAAHSPVRPVLKWPNDVLVGGRKIGGLLAEARWPAEGPGVVVVGLGLNLAQETDDLPPGATSLLALGTARPDRSALAAALLDAVDRHYEVLLGGSSLVGPWSAALDTLGREVVVRRAADVVRGTAVGVDDDGALVVRTVDGKSVTCHEGDVTLAASESPGS